MRDNYFRGQPADNVGSRSEEEYMTTAEQLRAEGLERGQAKTLARLLALKFGPLSEHDIDKINTASAAELDRWTDRVLTAPSLSEALR